MSIDFNAIELPGIILFAFTRSVGCSHAEEFGGSFHVRHHTLRQALVSSSGWLGRQSQASEPDQSGVGNGTLASG